MIHQILSLLFQHFPRCLLLRPQPHDRLLLFHKAAMPSTIRFKYRRTGSVATEKTTSSMMHFRDIPEIANNSFRKILQKIKALPQKFRELPSASSSSFADPVQDHKAYNSHQEVDCCRNVFRSTPNSWPKITSVAITIKSVSAAEAPGSGCL